MSTETVVAAWLELKPTLCARYQQICDAMNHLDQPVTARELRRWMYQHDYRYWEYTWTFMSKLERLGCVERCPARKCGVTGKAALTWRLR